MRAWRKVPAKILDDDQVSPLSDAAAHLHTILTVAQDDSGYYPWTETKVRRLFTSRPRWTPTKIKVYADELVAVGIAEWKDGGIWLVDGKALNGRPRGNRPAELYHRVHSAPAEDSQSTTDVLPVVAPEKSREEKKRVEKSRQRPPVAASPPEELVAFHQALYNLPGYMPTRIFWAKVYGKYIHLDLEEEAIKMCSWMEDNPNRQCNNTFILNWLKKTLEGKDGKDRGHSQEAAKAPRGTAADAWS